MDTPLEFIVLVREKTIVLPINCTSYSCLSAVSWVALQTISMVKAKPKFRGKEQLVLAELTPIFDDFLIY